MLFCKKCGAKLMMGVATCHACGASTKEKMPVESLSPNTEVKIERNDPQMFKGQQKYRQEHASSQKSGAVGAILIIIVILALIALVCLKVFN